MLLPTIKKQAAFLTAMLLASTTLSATQIVIPDEPGKLVFPPGETYEYPAGFLMFYIQKSTGLRLPIVKESKMDPKQSHIFVGNTKMAKKFAFKCKPEELIIHPVGKDLILCGEITKDGIDRGTLFAVYEYLERQYDIRWFYPSHKDWKGFGNGTFIPKKKGISYPKTTIRSAPRFQQREGGVMYMNYYGIEIEKQWHPVLRFGTSLAHDNANHTQINWVDLYADSHPEYFAKRSDGKPAINRRYKARTYICLSSEATLQRMKDNLKDLDAGKNPGPAWGPRKPTANAVFFACNDGMTPHNMCKCPKCSAMLNTKTYYEEQGSELFFKFASQYAEFVKKHSPQRRFAVLAYSHYLAPPAKCKIPDNMDVTYVGPRIHYANDPAMYERHKKYLKRWGELLNNDRSRLNIWWNIVNPTQYLSACPFMYPNTVKKFMKEFEGQVCGFFINGFSPYLRRTGAVRIYGTIMSLPMVWIQSRLMWNPDADVQELLKEYCQYSYGNAAGTMLEFYNLIISRWEGMYQQNPALGEMDYIHRIRYPKNIVAELKALLEKAMAETKSDKYIYNRIRYLNKYVYSRFFTESENYHKGDGIMKTYECVPANVPPVIDGKGSDPVWQDAQGINLVKFMRGEQSPRPTTVRMVHHNNKLYFLAKLDKAIAKTELRVHIAVKADSLKGRFAPNINRDWKSFLELRIARDGKCKRYGRFPAYQVKVSETDNTLMIEGEIDTSKFLNSIGVPSLRMQFLRYEDMWNDYDLWCPTMGSISDYPTWRFGLVQLLPAVKVVKDGLE